MIKRERIVNALRDKNFSFKRQADRVDIYKKNGASTLVTLRRVDLVTPEYAGTLLRQAGFNDVEIKKFISSFGECC